MKAADIIKRGLLALHTILAGIIMILFMAEWIETPGWWLFLSTIGSLVFSLIYFMVDNLMLDSAFYEKYTDTKGRSDARKWKKYIKAIKRELLAK